MPDTDIAQRLFSNPILRANVPQNGNATAKLCERCKKLELWRTPYDFSDTVSNLQQKSSYCALCSLLFRLVRSLSDTVNGQIQFLRAGSSLAYDGKSGYPIASLYTLLNTDTGLGKARHSSSRT